MVEPAKPFACTIPDCGMTFTNEDRLHVHTKKHDMALQFGLEQKSAFVADQTPTPTRFIRNCEEVGLFQDLQNVAANPFDEGFKRAMEAKQGICLEAMTPSDDVLHTPLVFPLIDGDTTLFTNNQRNITISRSSSDESGTIKEFESRTISKLTNEVTISRIVNSNHTDDITIKHTDTQKDIETVSYKNNVIKIESNVIRGDVDNLKPTVSAQTDTETKGVSSEKDTQIDNNKLVVDKMPIMSQKSIDFVVDSLTSELDNNVNQTVLNNDTNKQSTIVLNYGKRPQIKQVKQKKNGGVNKRIYLKNILAPPRIVCKPEKPEDNIKIEVVVKLPNGKQVKMRPIDENKDTKLDTKDIIRNRITKKVAQTVPIVPCIDNEIAMKKAPIMSNLVIPPGTLIPVTLVDQAGTPLSNKELTKVPIRKISNEEITNLNTVPVITKPIMKIQKVRKTKTHPKAVVNKRENTQKLIEAMKDSCRVKGRQHDDVELGGNGDNVSAEIIYFTQEDIVEKLQECAQSDSADNSQDDDCVIETISRNPDVAKRTRIELESRCAASKRYRERLKESMRRQSEENRLLREANQRLIADKAVLKLIITQHMKECSNSDDLSNRLNVLRNCDL